MFYFLDFIYDLAYLEGITDDLANEGVYTIMSYLVVAIALLGVIIWYYLWDSPKRVRLFDWLSFGCLVGFVVLIVAFVSAINTLNDFTYSLFEYVPFAGLNFLLGLLSFVVFSILLKWWSTNQRRNPF